MRKFFTVVFVFSLVLKGFSQDTIRISRAELEQRMVDQNLQVKLANDEAKLAQAELLGTRAMYLPNVNASYTFSNTNNPLYAFGSKLNQERITQMDFDPAKLNAPDAISNFATKIEVQQPIINMDAVYLKKAGQVKSEVLKIKAERTKEYIQFEFKKAYMQLQLAYRMLETLENAKTTTLANKKVIDNYFKNGMIQKTEVLYIDVRVKEIENQIAYAKSNIKNASDYLYFLLDEESFNKVFKPTEKLEFQNQILENTATLNVERKDLQAYQKSLEAYDYLIKSTKAKYKAELTKAQTEITQYNKQSQLELNKANRQVQDAENKVNLTKLALEQSKEAYRIRKNRYDQGLEKSSDLLMSETTMSQKDLEYQQAIFEYNVALEYYKFLKN